MRKTILGGITSLLLPFATYGAHIGYGAYQRRAMARTTGNSIPYSNPPATFRLRSAALVDAGAVDIAAGTPVRELVLVDASVQDKHLILKQAQPGVAIVEIQAADDGVAALIRALEGYKNLNVVHIVAHAEAGAMYLGGHKVDQQTLIDNVSGFAAINQAIREGGDLMLYGCDLAQGEAGENFLEILQQNTHVDIAASLDKTGNEAFGGNWELEIKKGDIETAVLADSLALKDFREVLFTGTINFSQVRDAGNYCGYGGTAADNASVWATGTSGYYLTIDGMGSSIDIYSGVGSSGNAAFTCVSETSVTLRFNGNAPFSPQSLRVANIHSGAHTFTFTSDKGSFNLNFAAINQAGATQTVDLTSWGANITYITISSSTRVYAWLDDFSVVGVGIAVDETPPVFQNSTPSVSGTTQTQTTLTVRLNEIGTAFYVVVPDGAGAPSSAQVVAGQSSGGAAAPFSGSINVTTAGQDFTTNITGLSIGTAYDLYVVARDDEGTPNVQASPTLVNFSSLAANSDGNLTAAVGVTEPVGLATTVDTVGEAVNVFDFTISDGGGGDGLSTLISQIVVNVSGTSTDAERGKVTWRLNGPDVSNVTGTYNAVADTITFSGLNINVADGGNETYTVNAYYNDNTGLIEDRTFILSVDGDTNLTVGASGTQMGSTSPVTNGTGSTIDVVATQLVFTTQPAGSVSGAALTTQPVVAARDAFGNTDVDFTETVTLTETSAGSLSNNTQAAVNGVATFTSVIYTATADQQSFTLTANDQDGVGSNLPTVDANAVTSDVVATRLAFTTQPAPTNVTSGQATAFSTVPVVSAQDANNIVDTGYATGITLSEVNGAGSATMTGTGDTDGSGATVTITPASGVATFTGLQITYTNIGASETFNLRASSGGLTTADSSQLTSASVPTVTDGNISISGASGTGGAYKIGDTVTATWNNTAGGDNNAGITGVTVDFSQFGGGAAVAASNSSNTWTATYTIVSGAIDGANRNVSVTATNASGDTTTSDTTNATVDNVAPTVTDARISISGSSGTGGAFKIGDTVTATWNNTAGGDNNSDTISSVTVDFTAFGGGAAVVATNSSGTWTATYTIVAGAIDATSRNVSVTATDNAGNTMTTADTTNATVDSIAPTVTDANISISGATGVGGAYRIGDTVTATWNNTAGGDNNSDTISGVTVDFTQFGGGAAVAATNSSGTWTATYTIVAGAIDTTNRNVSVTVMDNAGNTTATADTTNATVDNIAPTVSSVGVPANATYIAGQNLDFTVNTNDNVTVNTGSGTPRIALTIGATTRYATYLSGSGTSAIVFRYTVQTGDNDNDGIAVAASIAANGGTLRDAAGNDMTLTLNSVGATTAVLVDTGAPVNSLPSAQVTNSVTPLIFSSGSGNAITVADDGSLTVVISIGSGTLTASTGGAAGLSNNGTGTVTITGTAAEVNVALEGLTYTPSGAGAQTFNILSTDGAGGTDDDDLDIAVNASTLLVTSAMDTGDDASAAASFAADQADGSGLSIREALHWARAGDTITFDLDSGTPGNQGGTITLNGTQLTLAYNDLTINGDLNGDGTADVTISANSASRVMGINGSLSGIELSGLTLTQGATAGGGGALQIGPSSSITVRDSNITNSTDSGFGGGGIYGASATLTLINSAVSGNTSPTFGGGLRIVGAGGTLNLINSTVSGNTTTGVGAHGGGIQYGGTGSLTIVNSTISGNAASGVSSDGGGLRITTGTSHVYNTTIVGNSATNNSGGVSANGTSDTFVNTVVAGNTAGAGATAAVGGSPLATGVSANDVGGTIEIATNSYFGGNVTITTNNNSLNNQGTSNLLLGNLAHNSGGNVRTHWPEVGSALLEAGNNAALPADTFDLDGDSNTAEALPVDANGNQRVRNIVDIGAVEGDVAPTVTSVGVPANGTYIAGQNLDFTVNTDENVTVNSGGGTPRIALTIGANTRYASYLSGSGTSAVVFRYIVQTGDNDTDGIAVAANIDANGGTLRDATGNDLNTALNSVGSTAGVLVDAVAPTVNSVSVPANATYIAGQNLDFTVNGNENVTVNTGGGTPRIALTIGATTRYASYLSGSGTSAVVFRYTVQTGDNDTDGIAVAAGIDANGGTLRDAAGNNLNTALNSVGSTAGVLVDAVVPTVSVTDRDGDGMPDEYELLHGFDPLDPNDAHADFDGDGVSNLDEYLAGTTPTVDDYPPIISSPAPVTIDATGLLTRLPALAPPTAIDARDGALTATLVDAPSHVEPGVHVLTWRASDAAGNVAETLQALNVRPLISLAPDQTTAEGATVLVRFFLNGAAPIYPLSVDYTVAGTANSADHNLVAGSVVFENGELEKSVSVQVVQDNVSEGTETVVVTLSGEENFGVPAQHTIQIVERNVAPSVELSLQQGGREARMIAQDSGSVTVAATVNDPNPGDSHSYEWTFPAGALVTNVSDTVKTFDPAVLAVGVYPIRLTVRDNGAPVESAVTSQLLRIVATHPILSAAVDSDGDGIDDATEGWGDQDGDGVPDYLDVSAQPNVLAENAADGLRFPLEADPGVKLMLGRLAIEHGSDGAQLSGAELAASGIPADTIANVGGYFDLIVSGLSANGATVNVVIPQRQAIPANPVYRKFINGQWATFIEDASNRLASAMGEPGVCPPPGDSAYRAGLNPGDWCVQLTLQDGGPNDADGVADATVVDPGGVGSVPVVVTGTRGGGALSVPAMLMLAWLVLLRLWRRPAMRHVATFVLLAPFVAPLQAHAESRAWWRDLYVVGLLGHAETNLSERDVERAFAAQGTTATVYSADGSRIGWGLSIGYPIDRNWAVEAGYLDLGETSVEFSALSTATNVAHIHPASGQGVTLAGLYRWPLGQRLDIGARAGAFAWDAKFDAYSAGQLVDFHDDSGVDLLWGFSAGYRFTNAWAINLDLQRVEFSDPTHLFGVSLQWKIKD